MSLFNSSQIYIQEASIPIIKCPSYAEIMDKVRNMLQIHTTNGPVTLPPHREILRKDKYCWHIKSCYTDWDYNRRIKLFDGRGWL